tara:strand:+ start:2066 stop:2200 length:135 start_codon:yes stop_codon:yes gene_type:complete
MPDFPHLELAVSHGRRSRMTKLDRLLPTTSDPLQAGQFHLGRDE